VHKPIKTQPQTDQHTATDHPKTARRGHIFALPAAGL
jgi:hypothetical protein